jgi:hypothetical protein
MIIAIPLTAVIMGVVMITLAIQSDSGLVVDDYYQKGKQINRVLARDKAAFELGLAASLTLEADKGSVIIHFDPGMKTALDESIELNFIHATKPGLDQHIQLINIDALTLSAKLRELSAGRWNLFVQTADWRLTGSLQYPQQSSVRLLPNYFEN